MKNPAAIFAKLPCILIASALCPSSAWAEAMAFGAGGGLGGFVLLLGLLCIGLPAVLLILILNGFARVLTRRTVPKPISRRGAVAWFYVCLIFGVLGVAMAIALVSILFVISGFGRDGALIGLVSAIIISLTGFWSLKNALQIYQEKLQKD